VAWVAIGVTTRADGKARVMAWTVLSEPPMTVSHSCAMTTRGSVRSSMPA
jgi:hypothetical protein